VKAIIAMLAGLAIVAFLVIREMPTQTPRVQARAVATVPAQRASRPRTNRPAAQAPVRASASRPAQTTAGSTPALNHTHASRPARWVTNADVQEPASSATLHRFQGLTSNWNGAPDRSGSPNLEAAVRERVNRAVAEILATDALPGSWQWPSIRETARLVGNRLPLLQMTRSATAGSNAVYMGYEEFGEVFRVSNAIMEESQDFATSAVIHELTHRVVSKNTQAQSRLSLQEHVTLLMRCADYWSAHQTTSEALAHLNEEVWLLKRHSEGRTMSGQAATRLALIGTSVARIVFGDRASADSGAQEFAGYIRGYVTRASQRHVAQNGAWRHNACGPVPLLQGARRGQRFWNTDLSPARLVPVFDHTYGQ